MAKLCAELMKSKGQKRIDWSSPATRKENSDLVLRIRQELLRSGSIRVPKVYIHPTCPNEGVLRQRILRLGGEVVQKETAAVTHVVYPYGPSGDPDDGNEYLRTLEVRGPLARVHWWYLPDSYNEWIAASSAPGDVEADREPPKGQPWRVYVRWVTDSDKYNEWMNEVDYETEEAVAENKRLREAADGGQEGEAAHDKKRARKDGRAGATAEVAQGAENVVGAGAITRRVVHPDKKAMEGVGRAQDISYGQRQEWAGVPAPSPAEHAAAGVAAGGAKAPHMIPAAAAWFKFNGVSDIERQEFMEFWVPNTARNVSQYIIYRDHMIRRFGRDPTRQLAFVEAHRGLEGDANDIRKVYDFLCRWGLINFTAPGVTGAVALDPNDRPAGSAAVVRIKRNPSAKEAAEAVAQGGSARVSVRAGTFRRAAPQAPAVATGTRYYCNAYPNVDCTDLRYHCTKVPDVDLCPRAFAEGRFPPGCAAKDFIRVAATDAVPDDSGWTDQETLLLLEGLELYGDNWAEISKHVRGRSQLECVQRLLSLPVDDVLLPAPGAGGLLLANGKGDHAGNAPENGSNGVDADGPLPFADTGNPLMAQLTFLTSMVGPKVAAAAAQRALEVLSEEDATAGAPLPERAVRAAAAAGLASAAVKARLLADAEEREMQRVVLVACEQQLRRVTAKLDYLDAMDSAIKAETERTKARTVEKIAEYKSLMNGNGMGGGTPATGGANQQAGGAQAGAP